MNFFKFSSLSLGLTVLSVLCGGLSAQAEITSTTSEVSTPVTSAVAPTPLTDATLASPAIASDKVTEASTETADSTAIAPSDVIATTVPSATLDHLTTRQLLAHHSPSHTAATSTASAATPAPEAEMMVVETVTFTPDSTTAADLAPVTETTTETAEIAPATAENQIAQVPTSPVFRRPPANNYIGAGVNFGDDTSFAVISKFEITQFSSYGVALRPTVLFGDSVDFRIPVTIGTRLNTDSETANRFAPYAGLGIAIETEDDTDVDFMLTAGSDFLITNRFTANAALNLVFTNDTDLELLLGVGYNF